MSQPLTKKNYIPGSLRAPRSARTLLLRMAADQERAERVRQLKADHPEIKWRMVAEHVGVTERAAQEWPKSGGIEPTNAKKLAELFDVSYEWLWFGREVVAQSDGTPDPFAGQPVDPTEQLNRIEQALTDRTDHDEKIAALIEQQNQLLVRQSDILTRIETLVLALPTDEQTEELLRAARGEDQPDPQSTHAPGQSETGSSARREAEG